MESSLNMFYVLVTATHIPIHYKLPEVLFIIKQVTEQTKATRGKEIRQNNFIFKTTVLS